MSDEQPQPGAEQAEDDVRRKFREALERKRGRAGGVSGGGGPHADGGHAHTAAAKPQRTFRRKSGG